MHSIAPRNYSIDTLRFFFALLVVFNHSGGFISSLAIRGAVPFYLMISGYFLYKQDSVDMQNKLISTLKRTCNITLWSTILYAAGAFVSCLNDAPSDNTITFLSVAKKITALILFNRPIWGFHLWYLYAYLNTLISVWIILKLRILKYAYYFIPVLLAVSIFGGLYLFLISDTIKISLMYTRNFLFAGIPYFLIGTLIKRYKAQILKNTTFVYIGFFVSLVLSVCEYMFNPRTFGSGIGDFYITTAPMLIAIVLLAISINQTKDNILSRTGRNDSLYIYVFHPFTMMILGRLAKLFLTEDTYLYDCYKLSFPIIVFTCTIIGSVLFRIMMLPLYQRLLQKLQSYSIITTTGH